MWQESAYTKLIFLTKTCAWWACKAMLDWTTLKLFWKEVFTWQDTQFASFLKAGCCQDQTSALSSVNTLHSVLANWYKADLVDFCPKKILQILKFWAKLMSKRLASEHKIQPFVNLEIHLSITNLAVNYKLSKEHPRQSCILDILVYNLWARFLSRQVWKRVFSRYWLIWDQFTWHRTNF